jgi:hypothetical protein
MAHFQPFHHYSFYHLFPVVSKEIICNISLKYYFDLLCYFTAFHSHELYIPLIYKILTYPFSLVLFLYFLILFI